MQAAVDFVARCMAGQGLGVATQTSNDLGGVKFVQLTEEEYKALETKDPTTFYLVTKDNKIILYLGITTIGLSSFAGTAVLQTDGGLSVNGVATFSEIEVI